MDTERAQSLLDQLEDNVDELEERLRPMLSQALGESTKNLPLLDNAKLHIVTVYAIESLLFSYLKLQDVDAKEHPVFRELTRVKQYFEKVKVAEEGSLQPRANLSLDKQAAARIIKHSLAGNEKLDLARLEQEAREKLLAKRKLKDLETSMKERAQSNGEEPVSVEEKLVKQIVAEMEQPEIATSPVELEQSIPESKPGTESKPSRKEKKRKRKEKETDNVTEAQVKETARATKKAKKKAKKEAKLAQTAG